MKLILAIVLSFCVLGISGQKTAKDKFDVPPVVSKSFKKKFAKATDISFDRIDNNYKADFLIEDKLFYAEFTPEGEWVMTIEDIDLLTIYPPILKFIEENYPKYEILFVEKATRKDKKDYYYVQVAKKVKGYKEPLVIELFFDKTGRFEKAIKPEGFEDIEVPIVDDSRAQIPVDVVAVFEKKYPMATDINWEEVNLDTDTIKKIFQAAFIFRDKAFKAEFTPTGEWYQSRELLQNNSIYPPVMKYLNDNYPKNKIILAESVTRSDKKDFYYVAIAEKVKGVKEPYTIELFFDKSGKVYKINRPEELKDQYMLTVDIPQDIAKKFTTRFPKASDVTWELYNKNYTARFKFKEKPTVAEYTANAEWISTTVEIDPKELYTPIQRYLDKNFTDYKVSYAEKATLANRNDYYYLELLGKKKTVTPQQQFLYFDKMGRLKEEQ